MQRKEQRRYRVLPPYVRLHHFSITFQLYSGVKKEENKGIFEINPKLGYIYSLFLRRCKVQQCPRVEIPLHLF